MVSKKQKGHLLCKGSRQKNLDILGSLIVMIDPDLKFVKKFTQPNFRAKEFYTLTTHKL